MMANHVNLLPEHRLAEIDDHGVVLHGMDGVIKRIDADRIIIAAGTIPDSRLYNQIKSLNYEIHRIGDCLEARSAKAAIYEAARLGRVL
jgi:NADPH-dependent 2,4-dienoyl-CoA reductase/sulfur reductase-like enzyme